MSEWKPKTRLEVILYAGKEGETDVPAVKPPADPASG
jgi:hypothetical protein